MVKTESTLQAASVHQAPGLPPSGHFHTHSTAPLHVIHQALEAQWSVDFLCLTAAANPSLLRGSTLGNSEEVWDKVRGCWELAEADGGLQKDLPPQRLSLTLPTLL